ncbi:MAG: Flp family type IVb pilin [Novosphingobium sp.]|nr:Flp family type IVb pilin [Novosphingobium sp.]
MTLLRKLIADQSGATAIEYGLVAALIATGAIIAMGALGNSLSNTFVQISTKMNNASDGKGPF